MEGKARFIFPIFLSGVMAFLMTAYVTWFQVGIPSDFLIRWMKAWITAWPLAYIAAVIATPFARRATAKVMSILDGPKS